jgi:hypothetical protein
VNDRLKQLMKDLGDAINESLSESDQIAEVIARIKAQGYDVFLVLEATIGFNKLVEDEPSPVAHPVVAGPNSEAEFKINAQDLKFLKSLRISVND